MNNFLFIIPMTLFIFTITPITFAETTDPVVVLETSSGEIVIEFFNDIAPNHVDNFLKLTDEGFYDNTYFHRVIFLS